MASSSTVLSAGDCPVCSDAGALLFVVDEASGRVLLHCPHCECAWRGPADVDLPGDPGDLRSLGVTGVRAATVSDVASAGLSSAVLARHSASKYPLGSNRR
jgi:hypothetical protein